MNIYETIKTPFAHTSMKLISFLILATLLWSLGAPFFLANARAAQLTSVSDTLVDSDLSVATKHTISFVATNAISSGETIKISLDPTGTTPFGNSGFSEAFSTATSSDIFLLDDGTPMTFSAVGNYNGGSDENLTLTLSAGTIAASSIVTIVVGSSTALWTNPSAAGSRVIRIGGTMTNSGDTRVAVLDDVVVTASVDTIFTFTVSGLATSTSVNGETTNGSTTATVMAFNTLSPGVPWVMGQELSVSTNARNGFTVTVIENQNLLSSTGADIDLFNNGATTSTPVAWAPPSSTIDQDQTYGHMGLTSDDADLAISGPAEFVGSKYVGNFNTPRAVFSHNGPANGSEQNKGLAKVAFKIEIGSLQEAGNDYTNTLTYVATPTF